MADTRHSMVAVEWEVLVNWTELGWEGLLGPIHVYREKKSDAKQVVNFLKVRMSVCIR